MTPCELPGGSLLIRRSRPSDVEALFGIWQRAVEATHGFLSEADRLEIAHLVRADYLPAASFLVATGEAGRPLGFMGMTDARIDALFIEPDVHGQGIGRVLIAYASWPGAVLTVDVNEQNQTAVGFYAHLGFREVGRSAMDDGGRPYPILHMRRGAAGPVAE